MAKIPTTFEKKWPTVILAPISVINSVITVSSTLGLHTKQIISLSKAGLEAQEYEIKRVESDTTLRIGTKEGNLSHWLNPTQYDGGMLTMFEQSRNPIGSDPVLRAAYDEEPIVGLRTVNIDKFGQYIDTVKGIDGINRLATDTSLSVSNLTVSIDNASSLTAINTVIAAADTEQVMPLPANTARFSVRVRGSESIIKLAFTSGTSGTTYFTNGRGNIFESGELNLGVPYSVYYQTPKMGVILEWILWLK